MRLGNGAFRLQNLILGQAPGMRTLSSAVYLVSYSDLDTLWGVSKSRAVTKQDEATSSQRTAVV